MSNFRTFTSRDWSEFLSNLEMFERENNVCITSIVIPKDSAGDVIQYCLNNTVPGLFEAKLSQKESRNPRWEVTVCGCKVHFGNSFLMVMEDAGASKENANESTSDTK